MSYALFPSPVYALASWLDCSDLLFIALLSLPCFPPLSPPLGFGSAAGEAPGPPAQTPLLPLTHYGLLPSAGKPGWDAGGTRPSSWK